jgi:phage tail-like protein
MLPSLYQDDDLSLRFTAALDEVVSPIINSIDCLDAYLDPSLAPEDFVAWLATWVGLVLDENWPLARQRDLITSAVELYSWQGTRRAIAGMVALYVGVEPEVVDSGGAIGAEQPGSNLPGTAGASVTVTVRVPDPADISETRVSALVQAVKPAHVSHHVEILSA